MMLLFSSTLTKKARPARVSLFFFLSVIVFTLSACSEPKPESYRLAGSTMGTTWHVSLSIDNDMSAKTLQKAIESELAAVNASMSTYLPDSEINRFSRAALNEWQSISEDFYRCLLVSEKVARQTDGALDITVAPVVSLWGFGPDLKIPALPDEKQLQTLLKRVNYRAIELKAQQGTYSARRTADVSLDLSAVAKGYAVDKVAERLEVLNVQNYMVEVGGEIRLNGHSPRGDLWRIAVESPNTDLTQTKIQRALSLSSAAIATSGDYRNYYELDGKRYAHTINPKTGRPVTHKLASVTVITEQAAYADALATAFTVLGEEKAYTKAVELNLAVFFIIKSEEGFVERYTPQFETYLN